MDYKIELKNVKIYESLSEETNCFKSNLYINGKLVGYCENLGHGGSTFVNGKDKESCDLIDKVDEWCKKNPIKVEVCGLLYTSDSLESRVDDIIDQKIIEKEDKKIEKKCISNLCFTKTKEGETVNSYNVLSWKNAKISDMLINPKGREAISKTIKSELSKGYRLLNKNIPQELYK